MFKIKRAVIIAFVLLVVFGATAVGVYFGAIKENYLNVPLSIEAVPEYQASLSPRFSNVGYNAHIRRDWEKESYVSPQQQPIDLSESMPRRQVTQQAASSIIQSTADVPDRQAVYDRLVYSTARSRRYGEGDPIRGDLPIVPTLPVADPNSPVWFVPAASVDRDLRRGAMQVLDSDNETTRKLAQLKSISNPARSIELGGPGYGDVEVRAFN